MRLRCFGEATPDSVGSTASGRAGGSAAVRFRWPVCWVEVTDMDSAPVQKTLQGTTIPVPGKFSRFYARSRAPGRASLLKLSSGFAQIERAAAVAACLAWPSGRPHGDTLGLTS